MPPFPRTDSPNATLVVLVGTIPEHFPRAHPHRKVPALVLADAVGPIARRGCGRQTLQVCRDQFSEIPGWTIMIVLELANGGDNSITARRDTSQSEMMDGVRPEDCADR